MITLKSKREIDAMEESGALLASIHVQLRDFIKPGVTTGTSINLYKRKLKKRVVQRHRLDTKDINTQHAKVSMTKSVTDSHVVNR